jgi:hypothetical protein
MLNYLFAAAEMSLEDKEHLRSTTFFSGKLMEKETAIIWGAALLIGGALLIWAMFFRKAPKEVLGSRVLAEPNRKSQRYGSGGRRRHRKRRPTHPDNFGRNPTLAETGGLPPLRSDDPPAPTAASRPPEGFSPPV